MQLYDTIDAVFGQLTEAIQGLTPNQYVQPCRALSDSSIGQHIRHIIELFQCLEEGYASGTVEYDKRRRDPAIETNRQRAASLLKDIASNLHRENKDLLLIAAYQENPLQTLTIPTNYLREMAYNLEHTIHHMALVRIGIREISQMQLPDHFGVAPSTIHYRKQCAQ
jgi:hypothetical protein